ncbi:hypothetical protein N7539_006434 [Penicillium diatomitis]|uniref:Uncharacterized protein n=1 Tax=Penicillium diatomitis TaxID=2819901 RepID=A0A9W9X334_9EURO|nr:uncharacterized protein N7539_006434 [Penicillium diatomitis]KAJ5482988.1 hypothetical protein N7539_006434 [Penicillium diatomitis]
MLRSLILPALVGFAQAYRLFEYVGERCTGEEVGVLRLAGPSACTKLAEGVASSVLVKIDNIHDDLYEVNVYDHEDCTGSIVGTIANFNGCLDLEIFHNAPGKAVQVIPVSRKRDPSVSVNKGFVTDFQYNLAEETAETMKVPIMHGGFQTVSKTNHSEDGSYLDDAFGVFLPLAEEDLNAVQELWSSPLELTPWESVNGTSPHFLSPRQFEWGYCTFHTICLGAIDLGGRISNTRVAQALANFAGHQAFKTFWKTVDVIVGHTSNGITIISALTTHGTQSTQCDSDKSTGGLIKDLVNGVSKEGLTNAVWIVEDDEGNQFEVGIQLRPMGGKNPNSCGECALCQ